MRHVFVSCVMVGALVGVNPSASLSQPRQTGAVGLTVFADPNFRGKSATLRDDTPNFTTIGMNDMVSSLRVAPGEQWEVCEHINYQGRCKVFSGSESDLRSNGWNDIISSARRVRSGRGGSRGGPPPAPPASGGLELFSRTGFSGDTRAFTGPDSDLRRTGFNNSAQSLRVRRGEQWEVCVDINFVKCKVVNTDWSDLRGLGMSRNISSVRPWRQGGVAVPRGFIVLFDNRNYRGQSFRVDANSPQLQGFANRAQSVQVRGGTWQLCERVNFGGRCVTVSGDLPDLSSINLSSRVASVRLAATTR